MKDHVTVLGPIFHYWIAQLHQRLAFLAKVQNRKALYCTRAGKRIQDLIHAYAGTDLPYEAELFGISRIAACKVTAVHLPTFQAAYEVTAESMAGSSLADVCRAYLQSSWSEDSAECAALAGLSQPFNRDNFRTLLAANDPAALFFKEALAADRDGFEKWLGENLGDASGYVLVDSGWKGSIQRLLSESFPAFGFDGLYFGVMDKGHMPNRHGIVFDGNSFDAERPETVFTLHRHLVETILEPNAESVEALVGGPQDRLAREQIKVVANEIPDDQTDRLFLKIRDYISRNADKPLDRVLIDHREALAALVPLILYPTREDALVLAGKDRSMDFGRRGSIPVLVSDVDIEVMTAQERILASLWQQGQIALEYSGAEALRLQRQLVTREGALNYFAAHEQAAASPKNGQGATKAADWHGSVAIVTRTKNRPILFARAVESVAQQTHRNYRWVVVNDGGDPGPVVDLIEKSGVDRRLITLINNPESVGMEAASNLGVRAVDTEFVVIHDDDDQWEPQFLSEMVEFLQSPRAIAADFKGAICRAWRVSEEIAGDQVIIHARDPYMSWVSEVPLTQMAVGNFFAPISFLYRREVYDDIGGYDERLPVLGDWRFNLDFLVRANIGVLDRYLSHYHHRDKASGTDSVAYANSVVGGRSLHAQYFAVVTNGILRDPRSAPGLVAAVANAHQQRVLEHRFNHTSGQLSNLQHRQQEAQDRADQCLELLRHPTPVPSTPPQQAAKQHHALPESDVEYVGETISKGLGRQVPPLRLIAWPLSAVSRALVRTMAGRRLMLNLFHRHIPNPLDFDHIVYLRQHTEIWATRFNGPGEMLPYHHFLLAGHAMGYERPTLRKP